MIASLDTWIDLIGRKRVGVFCRDCQPWSSSETGLDLGSTLAARARTCRSSCATNPMWKTTCPEKPTRQKGDRVIETSRAGVRAESAPSHFGCRLKQTLASKPLSGSRCFRCEWQRVARRIRGLELSHAPAVGRASVGSCPASR